MAAISAGILLFRRRSPGEGPEFLLVHPGGPFWKKKDLGAWSIPKGLVDDGEDPLAAACREFQEELGVSLPRGLSFTALTPIKQKSGKTVRAWAAECDVELPGEIRSNTFKVEWPPRSGKFAEFPEVDRAGWFPLAEALQKILPAQAAFLAQCAALSE